MSTRQPPGFVLYEVPSSDVIQIQRDWARQAAKDAAERLGLDPPRVIFFTLDHTRARKDLTSRFTEARKTGYISSDYPDEVWIDENLSDEDTVKAVWRECRRLYQLRKGWFQTKAKLVLQDDATTFVTMLVEQAMAEQRA